MAIILNETEQAKQLLKLGEVGPKPTSTLFLLAKYYRQKENLDKEQAVSRLTRFMEQNYKGFQPVLWADTIEDICKKAVRYPLREISHVPVTGPELDRISQLPNRKYQKLAFTILCHAKLHNMISANNNSWANVKINDVYQSARVSVRQKQEKFLCLNDLERFGYLSFSDQNDNLNLKVNMIAPDAPPALTVSDFRELGYEYLNYLGEGSFVRCTKCGRLIKKKSKRDYSTKYCADCAKEIKNEQNKRYYRHKTCLADGCTLTKIQAAQRPPHCSQKRIQEKPETLKG